jgi:hypothetical protein
VPPPPPPAAAPPPGSAYPPAPPYGAPPPTPPLVPAAVDPHAVGLAVARLGKQPQKAGATAFGILSALLQDGEVVECLVQGRVNDCDGACALTNLRLILLNDRMWKPDTLSLTVNAALTVQGWQDDRTAALVISNAAVSATIDRIVDRSIAQEMAQRIRARAGTAPPPPA